MPARKKPAGKKPAKSPEKSAAKPVEKPEPKPPAPTKPAAAKIPVDPVKLARARQLLRLNDDGATIRRAIDYLLEHYHPVGHDEEE
jgi:hypothetical protein